ncbi:MAG: ABC transporter permease [Luteimonas sp.]|nr:ABC transporter permease [Luteimonas sp.]
MSQARTPSPRADEAAAERQPAPPHEPRQPAAATGSRWLLLGLRYAGRPIFLALVLLVLFLWLGSQQLDPIEQRSLSMVAIKIQTLQHIQLAVVSTVIVVILAVTTGILLTRSFARAVAPIIIGIANIGQAVPSVGLLALFAIVWTFGFWPAIVALVAYSFLAILRNTMVGLQQVDHAIIESARGMGMTKTATLFRIELPLAVPIILAGVRTALILNVGTATLATFIGAGGLGTMIKAGIALSRITVIVTGAVLAAVLALLIDWIAAIAEEFLRPKGL